MRLRDSNQENIVVGLRALKELVRTFQYEVEEGRDCLVLICQEFFPIISNIMQDTIQNKGGTEHQLQIMILVSKIFYMSNTLKLLPFLVDPGQLGNWIDIFVAVLES